MDAGDKASPGAGSRVARGVRLEPEPEPEPEPGPDGEAAPETGRADTPSDSAATGRARRPGASPSAPSRDGESATDGRSPGSAALPAALRGVEVTISVEVGRHRMPLGELVALAPARILELDRLTSDPARVLVNGQPFALGEIVAIGDRFAVRLTALEDCA
jgi:flagellar motor switch protein FliN/FliY